MTVQGELQIALTCDVTAFVMQTSPGHLGDELAAQLDALTEDEFAAEIKRRQRAFAANMLVKVDGQFVDVNSTFPAADVIRKVNVLPGGVAETSQSVIVVTASVPNGAKMFALSFPAEIGSIILTVGEDENASVEVLAAGQVSIPTPLKILRATTPSTPPTNLDDENDATTNATVDPDSTPIGGTPADVPREVIVAGQFVALGFWHIIPEGLDHILFVLGLFLLGTRMKPLLWQVTAFTVAHSVTLGLAMFGVLQLPSSIVEPLIAASIAYVAIENLFTTELKPWRPTVVFLFGLLHGLGFAGVLTDLGLPRGQFIPALIGFNIGVEFGQLAVIGVALLGVGWFRNAKYYRHVVVIPGSLAIAAIGLYWTAERIIGG